MSAQQLHFSPKQVAESLSVSESSIKRWCDRGIISTIRTSGGHRRITLDALQNFLESSETKLTNPHALGLTSLSPCSTPRVPGGGSKLQKEFRCALAIGDEVACSELLSEQFYLGSTRWQACETLIVDAMHGLGEAWDCHEVDVYQERRACDISQRLITRLRSDLPTPKSDAPTAIGGTPMGDYYQLATALVELALRETGWNAVNLGSNLPFESLAQAARDYNSNMVWLSVSEIVDVERFVQQQNAFAKSLDGDVALLVGGRMMTDSLRPRLRYTAHCDSLKHLVELTSMVQPNRQA